MSRLSLIILIVHALNSRATGQNRLEPALKADGNAENNESTEQLREFEVEELIKSLETCINAQEATSAELLEGQQQQHQQQQRTSIFKGSAVSAKANPNSRDRKSVNGKRSGRDQDLQANIAAVLEDLEARGRPNKKRTNDNYENIDEV
jgi:hypothetical protein